MPALSMFFGIIVRMQSERGGKHHKAHIHAIYGDWEIVIQGRNVPSVTIHLNRKLGLVESMCLAQG